MLVGKLHLFVINGCSFLFSEMQSLNYDKRTPKMLK